MGGYRHGWSWRTTCRRRSKRNSLGCNTTRQWDRHQYEFAISDYNDIMFALSQKDTYKVFHSLQSFLISAANISKIFWPVERKYDKRSEYLRNLLSIYDASPLKTRDPSNIFEHFGEILDDWYTESMHRNFLDM